MTFRELIQATEQVRDAIADGRWGEAAELEEKRRELLRQFIERQTDVAQLTQRLAQLNELTRNAIGETLHHQRKVEREVFTLQKGKQALDIYQEVVSPNP